MAKRRTKTTGTYGSELATWEEGAARGGRVMAMRTATKPHEDVICAVAHAALRCALADLPAEACERIYRQDVGDFDRAAAVFVQHLLAQRPA